MSATANHSRATSHRAPRWGTDPGRYFLRWAWVSVAAIPIGFALGMLVGEGFLALEGYGSGSEQSIPVGPMLVAAVPALAILVAPGIFAAWFGSRALAEDERRGMWPLALGVVAAGGSVLVNVLAYIVNR
jgi:hypothetical protein